MPRHFPLMVKAEMTKVLTRPTGWAGLILSLVIPLIVVAASAFAYDQQQQAIQENPLIAAFVQFEPATVMGWVLVARNFFIMPMVLLLVTAQLFAGERANRTLRSLLVRAVPRWSVLAAKFTAVTLYAGACLALTYLTTLLPCLAIFEGETPISGISLGYLACWLSDLAFICIAALVCTFTTSVAWAVVGTVIVMMGEWAARMGLGATNMLANAANLESLKVAGDILPWMPGSALEAWTGYQEAWEWKAFAALGGMLLFLVAAAVVRFRRTDVP